jgi:hypothetical protein
MKIEFAWQILMYSLVPNLIEIHLLVSNVKYPDTTWRPIMSLFYEITTKNLIKRKEGFTRTKFTRVPKVLYTG